MTSLADAIRERTTSAEAVVEAFLDAIATREHSGFVRLREAAREDAARAMPGPLHGIPFARKDMYFREGELCECGSRVPAGPQPELTPTRLSRRRRAGRTDS